MSNTKLIFENWRRFLSERKSDALYKKLVGFLTTELLKFENFYALHYPPGEEGQRGDRAKGPENLKHDHFVFFPKNESELSEELNIKWRAMVPQEEDPIFPSKYTYEEFGRGPDGSYESVDGKPADKKGFFHHHQGPLFLESPLFIEMIEKFRLQYAYADPKGRAAGWMARDGLLNIYHHGSVDGKSPQEAFEIMKPAAMEILDHELVHWINTARSGFIDTPKSAGGMKQYDSSSQEYVDSTEEMQARLIEAFRKFERNLKKPPKRNYKEEGLWAKIKGWIGKHADLLQGFGYNPYSDAVQDKNLDGLADDPYTGPIKRTPTEAWYLLLYTDQKRRFIKSWISLYYTGGNPRYDLDNHSKDNQQRLLGRVHDYLKSLYKSDGYQAWLKDEEEFRRQLRARFLNQPEKQ